nr:TrkA C-terminal domain-containing protein [Butyrivibrio sp. VCB2001]
MKLGEEDSWNGKRISEIGFPKDMIVVSIQRENDTIIPRGDVVLKEGDVVALCAEKAKDLQPIELREITINEGHSWNGVAIKDLDISRQSHIFLIRRNGQAIIPRGSVVINAGDVILLQDKYKRVII